MGEILVLTSRNDAAFQSQDYWRGRIWGPLNMLVYMGMRNYKLDEARKDLVEKSNKLFLRNFESMSSVHENYHAVSGKGLNDGEALNRSDSFYHWGALLGLPSLIEAGYMEGNGKPLQAKRKK